jgi:hypothetical protein
MPRQTANLPPAPEGRFPYRQRPQTDHQQKVKSAVISLSIRNDVKVSFLHRK